MRPSHRLQCLLVSFLGLVVGCPVSVDPGKTEAPDATETVADTLCTPLGSLERIPLLGIEEGSRRTLSSPPADHLLVVAVHGGECSTRIEVLEGCRVEGAYRKEDRQQKEHIVAATADEVFERLPLLDAKTRRDLPSGHAFRWDMAASRFVSAPNLGAVARHWLVGSACDNATHLVSTIELGRSVFVEGPVGDLLSDDRDFLAEAPPAPKSVSVRAVFPTPSECARRGATAPPPNDCLSALRVTLVPIAEMPPEDKGMIYVAGGPFIFGTDGSHGHGTIPKHTVDLDAFLIDRVEVSREDYEACVQTKRCSPAATGRYCDFSDSLPKLPINCVTWKQAADYCDSVGKRLPSELEWERAARGRDGRTYSWGSIWPPPNGAGNFADESTRLKRPEWSVIQRYDDGYPLLAPVGAFLDSASPTGALNMVGNVMEWTRDAAAAKTRSRRPNADGPRVRVVRGASFGQAWAEDLQVTHRALYREDIASMHIGFRCARALSPPAQ